MQNPQPLLSPVTIMRVLVGLYMLLLIVLLCAELGAPGLGAFRATNQVLLLLALLFLPFLIFSASRAIRTISVKFSGQEFHLELDELRKDVSQAEIRIAAQTGTAEQALWPILAGHDTSALRRLRERKIIIGAKLNTAQCFFAYLLATWLESRIPNLRCIVRSPNGGSLKNFADLKYNWIDIYVDYTGTCCQYFNIDHQGKTPNQLIAELNTYGRHIGLRWLKRLGASENYCLVIRRSVAEKEGIKSIRDLTRTASQLVFSADPEFLSRRDCFQGLRNTYDLNFKRIDPCPVTDRYAMLADDSADLFVGYETDSELLVPKLLVLQDTEGFFPDYHALPVVSVTALEQIEGLESALDMLQDTLSTSELTDMVRKLQLRGSYPAIARELAKQFLLEKNPT